MNIYCYKLSGKTEFSYEYYARKGQYHEKKETFYVCPNGF